MSHKLSARIQSTPVKKKKKLKEITIEFLLLLLFLFDFASENNAMKKEKRRSKPAGLIIVKLLNVVVVVDVSPSSVRAEKATWLANNPNGKENERNESTNRSSLQSLFVLLFCSRLLTKISRWLLL